MTPFFTASRATRPGFHEFTARPAQPPHDDRAGQTPRIGAFLRPWAEIDLAALERNVRLIRASLPHGMRYVAVVKADAYVHGLPQTQPPDASGWISFGANACRGDALRDRHRAGRSCC